MSRKIDSTFIAALVFALVAASANALPAAAASRDRHHRPAATHRVHHTYADNRGYRFDPRNPKAYGYVNIPPNAIRRTRLCFHPWSRHSG